MRRAAILGATAHVASERGQGQAKGEAEAEAAQEQDAAAAPPPPPVQDEAPDPAAQPRRRTRYGDLMKLKELPAASFALHRKASAGTGLNAAPGPGIGPFTAP